MTTRNVFIFKLYEHQKKKKKSHNTFNSHIGFNY